MTRFTMIIEQDEDDWFVSEVVELPGCHTQARTLDQLVERTREAIIAYRSTELEDGALSQHFVGVQQVEV